MCDDRSVSEDRTRVRRTDSESQHLSEMKDADH